MKASKRATRKTQPAPAQAPARRQVSWLPYAVLLAAAVAAFWAYAPAAHGPFLFDDTALPFALPDISQPLKGWVRSVRPLLMVTYWMNARISGDDPYSYHVFNVILHCVTSGLIFLVVRRLVVWAGVEKARRDVVAGIAGAIFLLRPVQTEAVAYL